MLVIPICILLFFAVVVSSNVEEEHSIYFNLTTCGEQCREPTSVRYGVKRAVNARYWYACDIERWCYGILYLNESYPEEVCGSQTIEGPNSTIHEVTYAPNAAKNIAVYLGVFEKNISLVGCGDKLYKDGETYKYTIECCFL